MLLWSNNIEVVDCCLQRTEGWCSPIDLLMSCEDDEGMLDHLRANKVIYERSCRDWQKSERKCSWWKRGKTFKYCLTFDLDALKAHRNTQDIFHAASDLFVMISSGYVENLVIETVLAWNLTVVDEPLVAVIVNWGIGNCVAMESRLWEREKTWKWVD